MGLVKAKEGKPGFTASKVASVSPSTSTVTKESPRELEVDLAGLARANRELPLQGGVYVHPESRYRNPVCGFHLHTQGARTPAEALSEPGIPQTDLEKRSGGSVDSPLAHGAYEARFIEASRRIVRQLHVVARQPQQLSHPVRIAVGGGGAELALEQQRKPVGPGAVVAHHGGAVHELDRVEVQVAQSRGRVGLDHHAIGRRVEAEARIEGFARHREV